MSRSSLCSIAALLLFATLAFLYFTVGQTSAGAEVSALSYNAAQAACFNPFSKIQLTGKSCGPVSGSATQLLLTGRHGQPDANAAAKLQYAAASRGHFFLAGIHCAQLARGRDYARTTRRDEENQRSRTASLGNVERRVRGLSERRRAPAGMKRQAGNPRRMRNRCYETFLSRAENS